MDKALLKPEYYVKTAVCRGGRPLFLLQNKFYVDNICSLNYNNLEICFNNFVIIKKQKCKTRSVLPVRRQT